MVYRLPPLNWLRAFEAAARHTSFTAASVELNLTQAAVSHQVRSLEQHLGFPLFERRPRSLKLTDIGSGYLPFVRKAFEELSVSTLGLFGLKGEKTLNIRAPVSFAVLWLAPRLGEFRSLYPDIAIRLCSAIWADAMPLNETDMDIRFGAGDWPKFNSELLCNETAVPVCASAYAARHTQPRQPSDLRTWDLIHVIGFDDLWSRILGDAQLTHPIENRPLSVDTSLAALELARMGQGCVLLPERFAERALAEQDLMIPLETRLPMRQAHYILTPEVDKPFKPEATLFREWLLETVARERSPT